VALSATGALSVELGLVGAVWWAQSVSVSPPANDRRCRHASSPVSKTVAVTAAQGPGSPKARLDFRAKSVAE
jgi:hypothetical protein